MAEESLGGAKIMYAVTYSGKPERSGEINDRFVIVGLAQDVPTWEELRESGEIPDNWEWYGTKEFETEAEALEFAEYRAGNVWNIQHN